MPKPRSGSEEEPQPQEPAQSEQTESVPPEQAESAGPNPVELVGYLEERPGEPTRLYPALAKDHYFEIPAEGIVKTQPYPDEEHTLMRVFVDPKTNIQEVSMTSRSHEAGFLSGAITSSYLGGAQSNCLQLLGTLVCTIPTGAAQGAAAAQASDDCVSITATLACTIPNAAAVGTVFPTLLPPCLPTIFPPCAQHAGGVAQVAGAAQAAADCGQITTSFVVCTVGAAAVGTLPPTILPPCLPTIFPPCAQHAGGAAQAVGAAQAAADCVQVLTTLACTFGAPENAPALGAGAAQASPLACVQVLTTLACTFGAPENAPALVPNFTLNCLPTYPPICPQHAGGVAQVAGGAQAAADCLQITTSVIVCTVGAPANAAAAAPFTVWPICQQQVGGAAQAAAECLHIATSVIVCTAAAPAAAALFQTQWQTCAQQAGGGAQAAVGTFHPTLGIACTILPPCPQQARGAAQAAVGTVFPTLLPPCLPTIAAPCPSLLPICAQHAGGVAQAAVGTVFPTLLPPCLPTIAAPCPSLLPICAQHAGGVAQAAVGTVFPTLLPPCLPTIAAPCPSLLPICAQHAGGVAQAAEGCLSITGTLACTIPTPANAPGG